MKVDDAPSQPFQPSTAPALPLHKLEAPPTLPLMHVAFVLAGLGTVILGPILPLLSRHWQLTDAHTGLLPLFQFAGSTLGGLTTSARLQRGLLIGLIAATLGFAVFAFAPGLPLALIALLVGGFGVGRTITTINTTAGARYTRHRASALSWLNFSWSFGALLSPLLAAWLTPRVSLHTLIAIFAACFLLCNIAFLAQLRRPASTQHAPVETSTTPLVRPTYLHFILALFLYGGIETSLAVWLTTYALRYGRTSLVLSEYATVLLLSGLTGGRALAAWLLLHVRETTLQRLALACVAALAAALATAQSAAAIASLAVLLGITLAPIFPATFALLMAHRPIPRQAGTVLAASGIGAAILPALMGLVSTRTGSLRIALALPVATALAMLLLTLWPPAPVQISKPASAL